MSTPVTCSRGSRCVSNVPPVILLKANGRTYYKLCNVCRKNDIEKARQLAQKLKHNLANFDYNGSESPPFCTQCRVPGCEFRKSRGSWNNICNKCATSHEKSTKQRNENLPSYLCLCGSCCREFPISDLTDENGKIKAFYASCKANDSVRNKKNGRKKESNIIHGKLMRLLCTDVMGRQCFGKTTI